MDHPPHQKLTYKTIGTCEIKLNLYLPPFPTAQPLPILLWFHGGGLLQGTRLSVASHMFAAMHNHKHPPFALISADYRLAPQASAAEILADVLDCVAFIRNSLTQHIPAGTLDTGRIVVSGSSAGGYLALLAGLYVSPPVRAVLAIYPITDPWGPFFTQPQPHSDERVERSTVAAFLDRSAPVMSWNPPESPRGKMYRWMMQEANLAELLGVKEDDDMFRIARTLRKHAGKKEGQPPIFVVHGDADEFVGVEQADEVVEALEEMGAVYEYERLPGLNHLFDKDEKVEMEKMYAFMSKYV